jgi:hypothetical protein
MNTNSGKLIPTWLIVVLGLVYISLVGYMSYQEYLSGMPVLPLVFNALLLSVPIGLLVYAVALMVATIRQIRSKNILDPRLAMFVYRTPRVAGLLISLFVGLFAFDSFSRELSFWDNVAVFLEHAAPAIMLLFLVAIAWRYPLIGAVAFGLAAVILVGIAAGSPTVVGNLLLFGLPMALIAALFWANWKWKEQIPQRWGI